MYTLSNKRKDFRYKFEILILFEFSCSDLTVSKK
jgi:hypothetical protein